MSFLARPFERRNSLENPSAWISNWFNGGPPTSSGVRVTPETALRCSAVFACIRVLAETMGSLSLQVYRRLPNGGKERFAEHPLYELLHTSPNEEMTSTEWRECMMGHKGLRGNGYSQVVWSNDGRPLSLWPLNPDRVRVCRSLKTRELRYEYTDDDGKMITYRPGEVMHERSFGGNGIIGYSPIRMAAEAVGISLAAEEHGARFFGQGASLGGIMEHPNKLSPEAYGRLSKSFADTQGGVINAHKPLILEEGMKFHGVSVNHEQAQFLETRKFQVSDIARIYRCPPHMIGDLERSTNNNIEHQAIEFVMHTMLPWVVRTEQRYNQTLLLPGERDDIFCEFNLDSLLRGDAKSRAEALQLQRFNGIINANEWREKERMNPYPGGEKYLVQSAMMPVEDVGKNYKAPAKPTAEQKRLGEVFFPVVLAGTQRALRKEIKAIRTLAKRADAPVAISQFYGEHRTYLTEQIGPAFESVGLALGRDFGPVARQLAEAYCEESRRLAEAAVNDATAIETLLSAWESTRAEQFARKALTAIPATPAEEQAA